MKILLFGSSPKPRAMLDQLDYAPTVPMRRRKTTWISAKRSAALHAHSLPYVGTGRIRIDHILLNKPAKQRLKAAEIDLRPRGWEKTSDHTPVWIELGAKAKRARKTS